MGSNQGFAFPANKTVNLRPNFLIDGINGNCDVRDADLRSRMGAAGREFALKRFDTKVMVDALEALYQNK